MADMGVAWMGSARGSGDQRAYWTANKAIPARCWMRFQLMRRGVLFNISGGKDPVCHEISKRPHSFKKRHPVSNIIFGALLRKSGGWNSYYRNRHRIWYEV
jgi:cell division GTPase FtsZ